MENIKKWRWFRAGRMAQVKFENGEDIARLAELDRKHWLAISMPVEGVRFDRRMLELMDTDSDGRIRTPEVLAAIEFLKSRNVDFDSLFKPADEDAQALAKTVSQLADLSKAAPGEEDAKAMAAWEADGGRSEVKFLGEDTPAAEAALAAVEKDIDAFFTPPDDMPLVTEDPDKVLPLDLKRINPKCQDAMALFSELVVRKTVGEASSIDRMAWKKIKAAFAPYRAWIAAKPVMNAAAKAALEDEERVLRYKLHLLEFLENYVNMKRLYSADGCAVFQTGTLRIDAKEMNLCFHVASESAHSALAARSNCCILYLKLSRKSEGAERTVAAVVTAGAVAQLYPGRNGVFYDRDGKDWEAVVTKVVESQVSLVEAFWAPWRKLGEGISSAVKKFLGDRQTAAQSKVETGVKEGSSSGAAMASSVAAVGIGVGMMGAAFASVMAAVSGMTPWQIAASVVAVILAVSLPSAILTWFKLRRRDLGAVLNASGWAINRPMYFSMSRARAFTKCARSAWAKCFLFVLVALAALGLGVAAAALTCGTCCAADAQNDEAARPKREWRGISGATYIGGRKVSPGYLRGKIVLLDCRDYGSEAEVEKIKSLQSVWATYKSKPFVLLGSHRGKAGDEAVKEVLKKAGVTYPVYRGAGITTGESEGRDSFIYVVENAGMRLAYRGQDEHKAQGVISGLIVADAVPPGPRMFKHFLHYELEFLPGKAYLRLKDFRERFPGEAAAYADEWAKLSSDEDLLELAKLVNLARLVKDRDRSTKASARVTPEIIDEAVARYSRLKDNPNPAFVQEAKNSLADLKWAAAALKKK
ncbi:MAG: hypothetical protein IKD42_03705 [Kiritimatiellae bacterium]|nr:hypothetical protein [Kiritimatiellia bacterium]